MSYSIVRQSGKDNYGRSINCTRIVIVPDVKSEGPATIINQAISRWLKIRAFTYQDFASIAGMNGHEVEFTHYGQPEDIEKHAEDLVTQVQRAVEFAGLVFGLVDDVIQARITPTLENVTSSLTAITQTLPTPGNAADRSQSPPRQAEIDQHVAQILVPGGNGHGRQSAVKGNGHEGDGHKDGDERHLSTE